MEGKQIVRNGELGLVVTAFLFVICGFAVNSFFIAAAQGMSTVLYALVFGATFLTVHGILRRKNHQGDPLIVSIAALLVGIGLVFLFRLRPALLPYQITWSIVGAIGFLAVSFGVRRIEVLQRYKYTSGVIGILFIVSTILFGVDIGGNKSWIIIGPLRFEPAEFAKILLVVFLAGYLDERKELLAGSSFRIKGVSLPHPLHLGPVVVMGGIALALLVLEKDLGAALLYYGTFLSMLYIASGRISYVVIGLLLFFVGGCITYGLFSHVRVRFDIWLNPWGDPDGRGFQILQSLFALGTGGIFGTGLFLGKPEYIPAVHTDFVFSAIGEELGLLGTWAILLLFVLLVSRGFRAAFTAQSDFSALLASGLSSLLALQTFVIIGGVTKFVPLTGVTLPFVSYGGSSMLTNFLILGLLHNVSEKR